MNHIDEDMSGEIEKGEFMKAVHNGLFDELLDKSLKNQPAAAEDDDDDQVLESGSGRARTQPLLQRERQVGAGPPPAVRTAEKTGLTEAKLKHLHDIFSLADSDGTGTIGIEELTEILQDESLTGDRARSITADYVANVMRTIDTSGDGELDFEEFCQAFQDIISESGHRAEDNSLQSAEIKALTQVLTEREAEIKELQHQLNESKQMMAHQASELQSRLEDAQESAQADLDRRLQEMKAFKKENAKLREEIRDARQTITSLENSIVDVREEAAKMEFQVRRK